VERARGACRPRVVIVTCIGFVSCKPIHVTITTRGGRRARFTVQRIRVPPCNPTHATTIRGLENAVWAGNIRFSHLFSSSLFSFLLSKTSRFSFCPPSFYVPHSLGHRHFICVSMRRKRSLRAGPGTFSVRGGARGQHPPLSDGTKMGLRDGHPLASMPLAQAAAALPTRSVLSTMSQCVTIASGVTPTLRR